MVREKHGLKEVFLLFYMGEACQGIIGRRHAERRGSITEQVSDERTIGCKRCRRRGKLTAGKMRGSFMVQMKREEEIQMELIYVWQIKHK